MTIYVFLSVRGVAASVLVVAALLGGLVPSAAAQEPSAPRATAPGQAARPRVVVFGDSMLAESSGAVTRTFRVLKPGWDIEIRAFPGTGICTWFDEFRTVDAQAAALLFSGVFLTDCIFKRGRSWPAAYATDARTAARIFADRGIPLMFLGWPRPVGNVRSPHMDDVIWQYYAQVAAEFGDPIVDPGLALFDPTQFAYPATMPCLSPVEEGCTNGIVPVRDAAGGHLCPMRDVVSACPVYSSGVRRYGMAVARAIAHWLPNLPVARPI